MSIDANDLVLFALVANAGSLTRAAEQAGLPKSTLSRRLNHLEQELGERLLIRTTRRMVLTEWGEQLLEHARRLLDETQAVEALTQHRQLVPRGLLRISLPPDFAELDLPALLQCYTQKYPEVRLELDLSPRPVDMLNERFDLAIRIASVLPDDNLLVARKIAVMSVSLYASPAYLERIGIPQNPDELHQHTALGQIVGTGQTLPWQLRRGDALWEGLPPTQIQSNSLALQRELASQGLGIVALSDRLAEHWVQQKKLHPVLPDWSLPTETVWGITPGRRLLPSRSRRFLDLLKTLLRDGSVS